MELYTEILSKVLEAREIHVIFPDFPINPAEIVEGESYRALQSIKAILEDDRLDDPACFQKIEAIISVFENLHSPVSFRHDFG